ncbi:hypothetical protein TRFO_02471 [Tritrichomonas foetus]|uniref:Uncharacterized protein n=1 Tax=Tritrichomonas foetus TaxID=1144522 RepID=A0A1J4L689_9EUKA|nr:hypothetical protein TRFO_02471 [Tritrichomonas foetus]|eukprot:OHT17461.1 hypothetical protein TRFO_02471 [Tritrichomonas foetus]
MTRHHYKKPWREEFVDEVYQFVEQNGIINSDQIYKIYNPKYGKKNWGAQLLNLLYDIISQDARLSRVEINIAEGKKIVLFEGRQGVTHVTFFLKVNIEDKIEKCQEEVKILQQKNPHNSRKTRNKTPKNNVSIKDSKKRTSTQFVSFYSPGFISSKYIRCQLLHKYLFTTFGTKEISMNDILNNMPIDLYFKIIGSESTPQFLIIQPSFRFILTRCFPDRVLEDIGFFDCQPIICKLLKKLENEFGVLKSKSKKYYLYDRFLISDISVNFQTNFHKKYDIDNFWRFIELFDRTCNFDHSSSLVWMKRWTIKRYFMKHVTENESLIKSLLRRELYSSDSLYFHDRLMKKIGYEKILFSDFLVNLVNYPICEEDSNVNQYCRDFVLKCPQFTLTIPEINIEPNFFDEEILFSKIISRMRVMPSGIIHRIDIPWQNLASSYNYPSAKSLESKFVFLFNLDESFPKIYSHNIAMAIYEKFECIFGNEKVDLSHVNTVQLCESQLLSHFHIINQQLTIKQNIGSLIEAFKRFLICSEFYYCPKVAARMFLKHKWKYAQDSVIFLKLLGVYREHKSKYKPFNQKHRKKVIKTDGFHQSVVKFNKDIRFASKQITFNIVSDINLASIYWFLYHSGRNHKSIDLLSSSIEIFDTKLNSSQNKHKKKRIKIDYRFRFLRLPLPQLPPFEIINASNPSAWEPEQYVPNIPIYNNPEYLFKAIPEFELILSQIQHQSTRYNLNISPYIRYIYTYTLHNGIDGLSLNDIRLIFKIEFDDEIFDIILNAIEFLEEFFYIQKKSSVSALPCYVANASLTHNHKLHYWTDMLNNVDEDILNQQMNTLFELIEFHPGIEIFDLFIQIQNLSVSDLLEIVNTLILDESIYMITSIIDENEGLFDETISIPYQNLSLNHILIVFYLKQTVPDFRSPSIKLYPTCLGATANYCL